MTRTKRFAYTFDMGAEFLDKEPALAQSWVDARREEWAKVRLMPGPRGGLYRLFTPPDEWRTHRNDDERFIYGGPPKLRYLSKRWGRYVRPDRIKPEERLGDDRLLTSFTIPVRDGKAMLPNGSTVDTESKWVVVPVPPAMYP